MKCLYYRFDSILSIPYDPEVNMKSQLTLIIFLTNVPGLFVNDS